MLCCAVLCHAETELDDSTYDGHTGQQQQPSGSGTDKGDEEEGGEEQQVLLDDAPEDSNSDGGSPRKGSDAAKAGEAEVGGAG